nr:uncharacterized protein At4g18257-like [Ipomoea trifida]
MMLGRNPSGQAADQVSSRYDAGGDHQERVRRREGGHLVVWEETFSGQDLSYAIVAVGETVSDQVTIVVVAVPEVLPLTVTLTLAYSMRNMMANKALYCVDFLRKGLEQEEPKQPRQHETSCSEPPEEDGDDDSSIPTNTRAPGLGRVSATMDRSEHKRFVMEVHEEANQARQKASELKVRRQEQVAARREKLKQAYLKKQYDKLIAQAKASQ